VNLNKGSFLSAAGDIEIFSCAIDPKDQKVAAGCGDGTVRIYDLSSSASPWKINTVNGMSSQQDLVSIKQMMNNPPITCVRWKKRVQTGVEVDEYQIGGSDT